MKFIPHDYQRYCITRILQGHELALLLDMGLGKTVITLTAVNDLRYNRFAVKKCLVIAPKKVAEDTWTREQSKWDHLKLLKVIPCLGSLNKRIKALNSPGDVFVINRENVKWLVEYYRNDWPFDMVVIDELSSFKSHQAQRFKALKSVRRHINRIIGLTGTPTPNGLMDLWAQIYLLDSGKRLGRTITEYRNNYFTPASRNATTIFSYEPLPEADVQIQDAIRDICISLRAKDYLSLPPCIKNTRYIKLDDKAQKAYNTMERDRILEMMNKTIDAGSAAVLGNKLLQLGNGAVYVTEDVRQQNGEFKEIRHVVEIHDNKIEAFRELVEELAGQHILVFYNFQHDKERIIKALKKYKLQVAELKDSQSISEWNAGNVDILLAHPASAAYGLNLQDGGNHVVWFGLNWSLELYLQANARLARQGQKQTVFIHHLAVSGSVDEDVLSSLEKKDNCQSALLEALTARIQRVKQDGRKEK